MFGKLYWSNDKTVGSKDQRAQTSLAYNRIHDVFNQCYRRPSSRIWAHDQRWDSFQDCPQNTRKSTKDSEATEFSNGWGNRHQFVQTNSVLTKENGQITPSPMAFHQASPESIRSVSRSKWCDMTQWAYVNLSDDQTLDQWLYDFGDVITPDVIWTFILFTRFYPICWTELMPLF